MSSNLIAYHKEETALAEYFKHILVDQKQGLFIAITGNELYESGTGKSHSAIMLAKEIDPTFNMNKVVYYMWQFMDAVNEVMKSRKHGQVIVVDEGGLAAGSQSFHSAANKVFAVALQIIRKLGCMIIFCMGNLREVDPRIRRKFSHHGWATKNKTQYGTQVYLFMYRRKKNMFNDEKEKIRKEPITMYCMVEDSPDYRTVITFTKFLVARLPKEFEEPYEALADKEKDDAIKDLLQFSKVVKKESSMSVETTPEDIVTVIRQNQKQFLEIFNKDMKTLDTDMVRRKFDITAQNARIVKKLYENEGLMNYAATNPTN